MILTKMTFVTLQVWTWPRPCPGESLCWIYWGYIKYFSRYWVGIILAKTTFVTLNIRSSPQVRNWSYSFPCWVRVLNFGEANAPTQMTLWPWIFGQGHPVRTWSSPGPDAFVYQIWWGYITYFFRYWAETILSGLHGLENKVKFTWFILVFNLPWCFCVQKFVKIHKIFPQLLSGNHLAYVAILNDLCDLKNKVKVTRFELGFCLAMGPLCAKFSESL